jgi:hypothetical protein
MEKKNLKYKIIYNGAKKKEFSSPCKYLKKNLEICMKNSDDNIIVCQSIRNKYEHCLEKIFIPDNN